MLFSRSLALILCLPVLAIPSPAATTIAGARALTVSVDPSGAYDIYAQNPAWHFSGTVGQNLSNLRAADGVDASGHYSEISFDFTSGTPQHAAIRAYWNQMAVLFTLSYPSAGGNFSFPNLTQYPAGLQHIAYSGVFANPTFTTYPGDSPW